MAIVPALPQTIEIWANHEPPGSSDVKGCMPARVCECLHTYVGACGEFSAPSILLSKVNEIIHMKVP